jgi:arylsulfatase A-like enzyme
MRRHADENFLLLIHTYDVHSGYEPPDEFRGLFLDGLAPPSKNFEPTAQKMKALHRQARNGNLYPMSDADAEFAKALYDAEIRYVDDWVGSFLAEVERLGLLDRATIVVLSDHGEEFQEHGWVMHSQLYSTVSRVPLIIRPPGGTGGSVVDEVVETIDIMPTLLEMTGVPLPATPIHGRSLLPLMNGGTREDARAFGEFPPHGGTRHHADPVYHAVTQDAAGKIELFEYRIDPLEQHDLAPDRLELAGAMAERIDAWSRTLEAIEALDDIDPAELDPEVEEQLRALGYLD